MDVSGYLELYPKGFGFLRHLEHNFNPTGNDVYVPQSLIRQFNLEEGAYLVGQAAEPDNNKNPYLYFIQTINDMEPPQYKQRINFREQVTINPEERLKMTLNEKDTIGPCLDALCPMGKGQRGLIVAPPKTGKTTILKHIALAINTHHPEMEVLILLVDERPEEVTDFRRSVPKAHVLSSSADEDTENHIRMTRLVMNSAIRKAEAGHNIVVLIDSLTRMGRAYNKKSNNNGRTLTGGLSANALELPRRFFGAARNLEGGGSLSIIATILVNTGSKMDEIIFQEFKGTGNLDLVLSQRCAEQRVWPAINIHESGTRKEHLLLNEDELKQSMKVRQMLGSMNEVEAMRYMRKIIKDKELVFSA